MPFQELTKMQLRKQMVHRVGQGELTVSAAARLYGVSRQTVRLWVKRSQDETFSDLRELSRRPVKIPRATDSQIEDKILELKAAKPLWGAKKILAKLWPHDPPVSLRTVDRILARHGLVRPRQEAPEMIRFERSSPNELLQMDFKALGSPPLGYSPLSVIDDATRFCLAFEPLPDHKTETIFAALWGIFGEFGLPTAILTDNEPCFADIQRYGPSKLEAKLCLLGVRMLHGRPAHPQTQGKVERFHLTVKDELGDRLRQPRIEDARVVYAAFVHDYNFERPHEALNQRYPGQVYTPSQRKRPRQMPVHEPPPGALLRVVGCDGRFRYKGKLYRAGYGLIGEQVVLQEEEHGLGVVYAGWRFAALADIEV
jgi:transposase InsO family protein